MIIKFWLEISIGLSKIYKPFSIFALDRVKRPCFALSTDKSESAFRFIFFGAGAGVAVSFFTSTFDGNFTVLFSMDKTQLYLTMTQITKLLEYNKLKSLESMKPFSSVQPMTKLIEKNLFKQFEWIIRLTPILQNSLYNHL